MRHRHSRIVAWTIAASRTGFRRAGGLLVAFLLAGCSLGTTESAQPSSTLPASVPPAASSTAIQSLSVSPRPSTTGKAASSTVRLLAVAGEGSGELWEFDGANWSRGGASSVARAMARDGDRLVLTTGQGFEYRKLSEPMKESVTQPAAWPAVLAGCAPTAVDATDEGRLAVALEAGETIRIVTVDPGQGNAAPRAIQPQPSSPFAPYVAWLDSARLLVLSTDKWQISRLAILDTAKRTIEPLVDLGGVRSFALSPSRRTLAVVTDEGLRVAPVSEWLNGKKPAVSIAAQPEEILWAVAMDGNDSRLALLSSVLTPDGAVTDVHDRVFDLRSGRATQTLDLKVPFTGASGQVWLS